MRTTPERRVRKLALLAFLPPSTINNAEPTFSADERRTGPLLQLGLAFVFVYAAVSALVDPSTYRTYLPSFLPLESETMTDALLRLFAVYEGALAVGVLTRRFRYAASMLSAATLLTIVAVNGDAFDVLFRNVAIALAALALAEMTAVRREPLTDEGSLRDQHRVNTGRAGRVPNRTDLPGTGRAEERPRLVSYGSR